MPESGDRVDLTLVIDSVDELYSGLAPRLCPDGLFIETDDPAAEGSVVGFRVVLADGVVLIQGRGAVLWTRLPGSIEGPPGMAVQFDDIDADTRETIDAVIDAHLSTGGELFDLDGRGIRDVYPTDVLDQSEATTGGSSAWMPDGEFGEILALASKEGATRIGGSDGGTEVVDLRFEEAIAGFTQDGGTPERNDVGAIDQAIAAAAIAPATANDQGGDESAGDPAGVLWRDGNGDQIPDILDQWREELEIAIPKPDQARDKTRSTSDATPWESLLPFSGEDDSFPRGPDVAPEARRQTSTARRTSTASDHFNRLWFLLPAAIVIVAVGMGLLLIGDRGEPPQDGIEPASGTLTAEPAQAPVEIPGAEIEQEDQPAAAPAVVPVAVPAAPAAIVRAIEWSLGSGATEVMIRGDGRFGPGQVDAVRLTDPPRLLVRVRRVGKSYLPNRIEVGSPELTTVRIGHHPELRPPTLYVVLDLAAPKVSSTNALKVEGDVARVTVRTAGQ